MWRFINIKQNNFVEYTPQYANIIVLKLKIKNQNFVTIVIHRLLQKIIQK